MYEKNPRPAMNLIQSLHYEIGGLKPIAVLRVSQLLPLL